MISPTTSSESPAPDRRQASAPEEIEIAPTASSVCEAFQRQVRSRGGVSALFFKGAGRWNGISWEQYAQAVGRIGGFLLGEGVAHGERTAILSYNRPEWFIADLAGMHVGAASVGIYLTSSAAQCEYILAHCGARVAFVEDREQLAKVMAVRERLPDLRRVVLMNGDRRPADGETVVTWSDALDAGDAYNAAHPGEFERRWRAVGPSDLGTLIYTSGTTGPPKAVMLDHRNLLWTAASISTYVPVVPDEDVVISYLPLAHIAERMAGMILHVVCGHRLYFSEDVAHLAANVAELHPTFMFGVPRIWEKFHEAVERRVNQTSGLRGRIARMAIDTGRKNAAARAAGEEPAGMYRFLDRRVLSKIREQVGLDRAKILSTGAAPISRSTLEFFWAVGLPLYEVYGQSENCGPLTTTRPGQSRLGSAGPPIPGVTIRLAEDGEILARGGNIFRGYDRDPEGTASALDAEGWLHTGDVGELDADGFLRITDRKKDLIITAGGKNISPSNIEGALREQPFIGQAVVVGDRRPFVTALLTLNPDRLTELGERVGTAPDMATLAQSDAVRAILQQGVDAVNAGLSNVERVKKFTVLPTELSVESGDLTPTLKVKRKVVNERLAAVIDELYAAPLETA